MSSSHSSIAIKVENLGKKYVINHEKGNGDDNFREVVIGNTKKIISSLNPFSKASKSDDQSTTEDFWALDDVNFTINKGDKVGIIGRNGAGKSTLLKVLSRITEPTTGKIQINGRIASLLEVGTGFHPELTGRENIYLNGAILGMSRKEIKSKFDEIVAFAEVDKFLDTPVKRYSSGMYVRLAFSVAAHLEPEILVVDEVLAVGDVEFQKKCLGKMSEVSKEGRTILFVSHNMNAISILCNKVILLKSGVVQKYGNVEDVISLYMNDCHFSSNKNNLSLVKRHGSFGSKVKIINCILYNSKLEVSENFRFGESFYVYMECIGLEKINHLQFVVGIDDMHGQRISTTLSYGGNKAVVIEGNQVKKAKLKVNLCLTPGIYSITLSLRDEHQGYDQIQGVVSFSVDDVREKFIQNDAYVDYGLVHLPNPEWEIK